jgi:hypothetical protein
MAVSNESWSIVQKSCQIWEVLILETRLGFQVNKETASSYVLQDKLLRKMDKPK